MRYPASLSRVTRTILEVEYAAERKRQPIDPYPRSTTAQVRRAGQAGAREHRWAAVLREVNRDAEKMP